MSCTACTWACTPSGTMRSRCEGRWLAGVLAGGPGAALCHLCAGKLWEVSRFPAPVVDVVVLRHHRSRPGPRFHRARNLHPRDVSSHRRIPVTSVHRLLVDLSAVLTPHQVANVISSGVWRALRGCPPPATPWRASAAAMASTCSSAPSRFTASAAPAPQWRRRHLPAARLRLHRTAGERRLRGIRTRLPLAAVQAHRRDRRSRSRPAPGQAGRRACDRTLRELDYMVLRFTDADVYQRPREHPGGAERDWLSGSRCRSPGSPPPAPRRGSASSRGGCRRGR